MILDFLTMVLNHNRSIDDTVQAMDNTDTISLIVDLFKLNMTIKQQAFKCIT